MFKNLLTAVFLLIGISAFAQTGSIKGIVKDSLSKEDIIGASVFLEGTTQGAATDIDGSFEIRNVKPGTYNLIINFISYSKKTISATVEAGKATDLGLIDIKEIVVQGEEVVIVGVKETHTESAVIMEIKESEQVVSGISSEQISKSQDRDAAQVLSRVPGVTIQDNKFVLVRGLNQRYNGVMLNGVNSPSTETDSRAFAFDVIPSSMIDRVLVYKSGAPELIGDMTGSLVKVYTKNSVSENYTNVNIGLGYRSGTTFTTHQSQTTYGADVLGLGNLNRQLPSSFPTNLNDKSIQFDRPTQESAAKSLNPDWGLTNVNSLPDMRLGIDLGRVNKFGSKRLSTIIAVNYSKTSQFISAERKRYNYDYTQSVTPNNLVFNYKTEQLEQTSRLGALANFSLALNHRNKIELRNMFNQSGIAQTTIKTGTDNADNTDVLGRGLYYQQRSIISSQLGGEHELKNGKTKLDWTLGFSNISKKEPNYRRAGYLRQMGTNEPFIVSIPSQATDNDASTFDSKLNENILGAAINAEHQLTPKTDKNEGIKLRAGIYLEQRSRKFESRWMSYVGAKYYDAQYKNDPLETIFSPDHIDLDNGFYLSEGTDGTNKYTASNTMAAGYVGATIPLGKFNIATGVRIEHNTQKLDSKRQDNSTPVIVNNPLTSVLPSINVAYNLTKRMLVRAAFAQTLNRPEFREIAPFGFYDFENSWKIKGNPLLKIATVNNYDVRWEYYPTPNESISFGAFYKDITNAIEMAVEPGAGNDLAFYYTNAAKATCYGLEAELRKSLSFVAPGTVLDKFSVLFNGSLIKSEVNLNPTPGQVNEVLRRPLQGQSPYVVNTGLYFNDEKSRLQVNVLYNVFGPRYVGIGSSSLASIYLVQRNVIDLTITKAVGKHLEVKAGIQDILNQSFILKEDSDRDYKSSAADQTVTTYKKGSYFTLGFGYKF